jgi:hypothetical protein
MNGSTGQDKTPKKELEIELKNVKQQLKDAKDQLKEANYALLETKTTLSVVQTQADMRMIRLKDAETMSDSLRVSLNEQRVLLKEAMLLLKDCVSKKDVVKLLIDLGLRY